MTSLRSAQLLVLLLSLSCAETGTTVDSDEASGPAATRPNILLIVADDMGYTDVGSFGSEIATPNLDELAFGGIRFTSFHAASSCGPTRAMLMSGATSREAGVSGPAAVLSHDVAPLPALLRDAGYHTYMTGKWHLGHEAEQSPAARGFESSFALVRAGDNHLGASNFPDDVVAYRENGEPIAQLPEDWFSSQMYTDKLLEYIQANEGDGTPWFGYLAFTAPHWPLQVPDDWRDRYGGRYDEGYDVLREQRAARAGDLGILPDGFDLEQYQGIAPPWTSLDDDSRQVLTRSMELYAAMLENMDLHVGRVLEYLEASNQLENTVVLFFSDNGASGSDSTFRPTTIPRTDFDSSLPIPGAVRFDHEITRDATNRPTFLPPAESLARSIGDLGISNDTHVVFYDDVGGVRGTRAWVVLRHYGQSRVSILNGGWLTWMAEGRDVSIETPVVAPTTFRPAVSRSWIATAEDVLSAIDDPETNIIDTRTAGEIDGSDLRRVARGGHIPSAIGIHWEDTLETRQRTFKPAEDLRELFEGRGVDAADPAILYCAVGARASHELFVMHLLGYDSLKLYLGSWRDWGNHGELPISSEPTPHEPPR